MSQRKIVLPDHLPEGEVGDFVDFWQQIYQESRPEEFDFPPEGETSLICQECRGKFYATEWHTCDCHYDEMVCQGCLRIVLVYFGTPAKTIL